MDANQPFEKSDWTGEGQAWATAPSMLKRIAAEVLCIPQELEYKLLPSPYLPIAKMLEFPLPLQSAVVTAPQPAQYFSKAAPDINDPALLRRVRHLPIPDTKTINKLAACARQAWLDGFQSVMYSHLDGTVTHFGLWIVTFWVAVKDIKRDAWGPFRKSQAWINKQKLNPSRSNPNRAVLAEEASFALTMLPWGCAKPPGLSDSEPLHTLSRFAGPNWLTGSNMNDMLELLRYKINSDPELAKNTRVSGTALIPKILEAYRAAAAVAGAARVWRCYRGRSSHFEADGWVFVRHAVRQRAPALCGSQHSIGRSHSPRQCTSGSLQQNCSAQPGAGDEDSDDRSDQNTATSPGVDASDSDSDAPIRRPARPATFSFVFPAPSSSPIPLPASSTRPTAGKRPKGHPDAPTPNPSPQKRRLFKRQADDAFEAPAQPLFRFASPSPHTSHKVDVFGPVAPHPEHDGYGSDSESASGRDGADDGDAIDEYSWGPEDDAPEPPDGSCRSIFIPATLHVSWESSNGPRLLLRRSTRLARSLLQRGRR
ncbi:hypothetical protein C8R47DRAFT_1155993 [Mycena vitilis]|nr:hypothetical protein C8R47DRAFT_1155993 [Mycena vitilis]